MWLSVNSCDQRVLKGGMGVSPWLCPRCAVSEIPGLPNRDSLSYEGALPYSLISQSFSDLLPKSCLESCIVCQLLTSEVCTVSGAPRQCCVARCDTRHVLLTCAALQLTGRAFRP